MFQNILVAMDSTPTAQAVFTKAVALAQAMNASLMVLHVLSADDEGSPGWPLGIVEGSDQSGTSQETPMFLSVYDEINWEAHRRQWQQYEKESREKPSAKVDSALYTKDDKICAYREWLGAVLQLGQ